MLSPAGLLMPLAEWRMPALVLVAVFTATAVAMERARRAAIERVCAQRARRLQLVFDRAVDGILVTDSSGRIELVNPRACELLGYSGEELLGLHTDAVIGQAADRAFLRHKAGALVHADVWIEDLGEGLRQVVVRAVVDQDAVHELPPVPEVRSREGESTEALGRLAGGVAHDVNNLLTVIRGYGELLRSATGRTSAERASLDEMLAAAERGRELTRQLSTLSPNHRSEPQRLEPDPVLLTMQGMLVRRLPPSVQLSVAPGAPDVAIWIELGQLQEVITNLVLWAGDAMPEGGAILLTTSVEAVGVSARGCFVLSISNDGPGFDAATLRHLLEPYFVPEALGRSAGLRLATVQSIVSRLGGELDVASKPGEGTTMRVRIPLLEPQREPGVIPEDEMQAPTGTVGTAGGAEILVVEDEAALRTLSERVLVRAGFTVRCAPDVVGARQLLQQAGYRPRVAVLDLELPGLSGLHLARSLHETMPEVRILIVSGVLASFGLDELSVRPEWRLLAKPYLPDALVEAVTELASRAQSGS